MIKNTILLIILLTTIFVVLVTNFLFNVNMLYNQSIEVAQTYSDIVYYTETINLRYTDEEDWNKQLEKTVDAIYTGDIEKINLEAKQLEHMYDKAIREENKKKEDNPIRYFTTESLSSIFNGLVDGFSSLISSTLYIINPFNWDDAINSVISFCKDPIDSLSFAYNNFKAVVKEEGILYTISYVLPNIMISKVISDTLVVADKVLIDEMYYITPGNKYSGLKYSPNINQEYTTDSLGRITSASAKDMKIDEDNVRNTYAQSSLNKREGDDAGHLIAHQFGGSGNYDNLVSMNRKVNRGNYKEIENDIKKAIENDKTADLKVDVTYKKFSDIPYKFTINYSIDKIRNEVVIYNF